MAVGDSCWVFFFNLNTAWPGRSPSLGLRFPLPRLRRGSPATGVVKEDPSKPVCVGCLFQCGHEAHKPCMVEMTPCVFRLNYNHITRHTVLNWNQVQFESLSWNRMNRPHLWGVWASQWLKNQNNTKNLTQNTAEELETTSASYPETETWFEVTCSKSLCGVGSWSHRVFCLLVYRTCFCWVLARGAAAPCSNMPGRRGSVKTLFKSIKRVVRLNKHSRLEQFLIFRIRMWIIFMNCGSLYLHWWSGKYVWLWGENWALE